MCCSPIREVVRAAAHYFTRALQTLIHGKDCYIVIVIYLPFWCKCLRYNQRTTFQNFWPRVLTSINTRLRRASIPLKPAPDIVWCPSRLHRCSRYNNRTTFRNHLLRASTSINTRLRWASFPLKPTPGIVWCPFPLRHTRNQHGQSAITTHLVSIVNAYKVYNNVRYVTL